MTKPEIVEQLLQVEQAYPESQQQLAGLQFGCVEYQQGQQDNKQRSH